MDLVEIHKKTVAGGRIYFDWFRFTEKNIAALCYATF